MQNWNDLIRTQLDNLASFPAKQTWKLGEWIGECAVRPEVANFAALPLVGNSIGDARISIADQTWYIWDGAAWQSMGGGGGGGVNNVTASAPIASSGGANPNISLTGIVDAAHGGTGLAAPGAVGNVLTSTGAGWASSAPATTSPAAPLTSVQFNNGGAFGGSAGLTWNGSTLAVDGAVDRATAGTLTVGGTTATAITVGKVGVTTTFPGPVNLTGDVTTVGGTQFTTDAQFDGNVTFGNAATDNISFVGQVDTAITQEGIAAPAVSPAGTGRIYFDSGSNTFKVSQNGAAYVDMISGGTVTSITLAASTTGLTISGGASQTITSSGTFTLGGTLAPANGGTGLTSPGAAGNVLTSDGAGNWTSSPAGGVTGSGTSGELVLWNGTTSTTGSPYLTWADVTGGTRRARVVVSGSNTNEVRLQGGDQFGEDANLAFSATADFRRGSASNKQGALFYSTALPSSPNFSGYGADWFFGQADEGASRSKLVVWGENNSASGYPTASLERVAFRSRVQETVFNDPQNVVDFRVATDNQANTLFVQGSTDRVGVLTNAPVASVDVASGQAAIPDGSAAAPSLAFRDDLDTGVYSSTNGTINLSSNGVETARFYQSAGSSILQMDTSILIGNVNVADDTLETATVMIAHADQNLPQEGNAGGQFIGLRTRGTGAAPTAVGANDGLASFFGKGLSSTAGVYNTGAIVSIHAEEAFTSTAGGGRIVFYTVPNGTTTETERMRITNAGFVGIATSAPTTTFSVAEKFQVNSTGNLVKVNNVTTSFPASQGGAGTVLQNDGAGNLSWATPSTSSGTVDVTGYLAQEALNAGDLVRFVNDAGTPKVQKADATNTDARLNPVGFAVAAASSGAAVTVRVAGAADVPASQFDSAPAAANVGQRVFVSTTSGKVTITAPSASGDILQRVGVLVDGGANPKVLVQIGDPTLL